MRASLPLSPISTYTHTHTHARALALPTPLSSALFSFDVHRSFRLREAARRKVRLGVRRAVLRRVHAPRVPVVEAAAADEEALPCTVPRCEEGLEELERLRVHRGPVQLRRDVRDRVRAVQDDRGDEALGVAALVSADDGDRGGAGRLGLRG